MSDLIHRAVWALFMETLPSFRAAPTTRGRGRGRVSVSRGFLSTTRAFTLAPLLPLLLLLLLPSCSRKLDTAGSCDMRSPNLADSQVCMDVAPKNLDKVKAICARYTWSDKPCDRAGSLGGCRADHSIRWEYPSSKMQTAADVKKTCGDDDYVGPEREPKD